VLIDAGVSACGSTPRSTIHLTAPTVIIQGSENVELLMPHFPKPPVRLTGIQESTPRNTYWGAHHSLNLDF